MGGNQIRSIDKLYTIRYYMLLCYALANIYIYIYILLCVVLYICIYVLYTVFYKLNMLPCFFIEEKIVLYTVFSFRYDLSLT